jgi:hypothetical protein
MENTKKKEGPPFSGLHASGKFSKALLVARHDVEGFQI